VNRDGFTLVPVPDGSGGSPAIAAMASDDVRPAFHAFRRSAAHHLRTPYKQRRIAFDAGLFEQSCRAALNDPPHGCDPASDAAAAQAFFRQWFSPWRVEPSGLASSAGSADAAPGRVTAFYEPVIEARRRAEGPFRTPFLARPEDLVEFPDGGAAAGPQGASGLRFGRLIDGEAVPYADRADIETGALSGRGLEIAFVRDPVDAFFAHVQGCARLILPEGEIRITYDGKSGQPFTGIGRLLVERGQIDARHISMQSIRAWLAANPEQAPVLMRENRSYIFFREVPAGKTAQDAAADAESGPVAAAKVPLEPGRSIAVDRLIHAFGLPFFIEAPGLKLPGPEDFARLMIAQDTGSAIIGPARADIFTGSGDAAGDLAGAVNAAARFHILLPRGPVAVRGEAIAPRP
jgi:membrane-bound lytic murein transglycosylase A